MTEPEQTDAPPAPEVDRTVWVESGLTDQGSYFIGFRCGDAAWTMSRTDAQLYAVKVLQLVQRAEYDSAVTRLFVNKIGMDLNTAGEFIATDFREGREPVRVHDACRLGFVVGVSHRGFKPFLTVTLDGDPIGQWDLDAARDHALGVIEMCEAVDLDQHLRRVLTDVIGLDPDRVKAVINDLQNHRWKPGDDETPVMAVPDAVPPA